VAEALEYYLEMARAQALEDYRHQELRYVLMVGKFERVEKPVMPAILSGPLVLTEARQ